MRMLIARVFLVCLALLFAPARGAAHEFSPSFFEFTEEGSGTFFVSWRPGTIIAIGARTVADLSDSIEPVLPESCAISPLTATSSARAERTWRIFCGANGLSGQTIAVSGLARHRADVLTRVRWADGSERLEVLDAATRSIAFDDAAGTPLASSRLSIFGTYLWLGVEHILFGPDHLLFVLLLTMLVPGARRITATVTGFTVGHSVTLVGATLGWMYAPIGPIEALIAFSVLLLAAEAADPRAASRPAQFRRHPWLVAGLFGLLHGFGFSSALGEVGLPADAIPFALAAFNVGVELGQIAFVAVLLLLATLYRRVAGEFPAAVLRVVALATGTLAAYWFVERSYAVIAG